MRRTCLVRSRRGLGPASEIPTSVGVGTPLVYLPSEAAVYAREEPKALGRVHEHRAARKHHGEVGLCLARGARSGSPSCRCPRAPRTRRACVEADVRGSVEEPRFGRPGSTAILRRLCGDIPCQGWRSARGSPPRATEIRHPSPRLPSRNRLEFRSFGALRGDGTRRDSPRECPPSRRRPTRGHATTRRPRQSTTWCARTSRASSALRKSAPDVRSRRT